MDQDLDEAQNLISLWKAEISQGTIKHEGESEITYLEGVHLDLKDISGFPSSNIFLNKVFFICS